MWLEITGTRPPLTTSCVLGELKDTVEIYLLCVCRYTATGLSFLSCVLAPVWLEIMGTRQPLISCVLGDTLILGCHFSIV